MPATLAVSAAADLIDEQRIIERKNLAVRLLESRAALNYQHVAQHLRMTDKMLQRWRAADKDFDARMKAALAYATTTAADAIENTVLKSALDGDTRAGIFMLQAHKPDRYRPDTKGLTNNGTVINIGSLTIVPREDGLELPALDINTASDTPAK